MRRRLKISQLRLMGSIKKHIGDSSNENRTKLKKKTLTVSIDRFNNSTYSTSENSSHNISNVITKSIDRVRNFMGSGNGPVQKENAYHTPTISKEKFNNYDYFGTRKHSAKINFYTSNKKIRGMSEKQFTKQRQMSQTRGITISSTKIPGGNFLPITPKVLRFRMVNGRRLAKN
mmetsp:Transcript_18850/g.16686  ORF Transcript_18850/g.16686 Transcript_18850/m.16686 type:complete len:174 (+) Transcript_18850:158-679(+)